MGFQRRARRVVTVLPHIAFVIAGATAAALLERGRRRRGARDAAGTPSSLTVAPSVDLACEVASEPAAPGKLGAPSHAGPWAGLAAAVWERLPQPPGLGPAAAAESATARFVQRLWAKLLSAVPDVAAADAPPPAPEPRAVDAALLEALQGTWAKDFARAEPMDEFFDLFGVNRLLRKAARLMRGMRIELAHGTYQVAPSGSGSDSDSSSGSGKGAAGDGGGVTSSGPVLRVTQACALPWFSVVEDFPLAPWAEAEHRRRDMRGGRQRGALTHAAGDLVTLAVTWGEPLEGGAVDEIRLVRLPAARPSGGGGGNGSGGGGAAGEYELHVVSSAWVGDRRAQFRWVCVKR